MTEHSSNTFKKDIKSQTTSFQHYVPRFLLDYFSDDGLLWVYDRVKNEFRKQPPKATAGEKAYYVFTDKKGKKHDTLEKMFSQIESVGSSIINDIVRGKDTLTMQEKVDLATFIAALYLRVPESIKRSEDMATQMTKELMSKSVMFTEHFNKEMDEIEKKEGIKVTPKQRENIQRTFRDKDYDMVFPKGYLLRTMLSNLQEIYKLMVQMEWIIIRTPKDKTFISSDHPAFTFNPRPEGWGSGIGLLAQNCETIVILTPKVGIYLSQKHNPEEVRAITGNPELIDNFNFRVAVVSSRFVVSHSEALLRRWIDRTKLNERGPYSRVKVG